jgi:hypothetical protein
MTEAEWQTCSEPALMLGHLQQAGLPRTKGGRRKLLIYGAACCRRVWDLLPDVRFQQAVHSLEQFADGAIDRAALGKALLAAKKAVTALKRKNRGACWDGWHTWMGQDAAAEMVVRSLAGGSVKVAHQVSGLIPTAFYWAALANTKGTEFKDAIRDGEKAQANGRLFACLTVLETFNPFRPVRVDATHRTPTIASLARAAYDERAVPSGELDPHRLAVLADALEEADAPGDMVAHLRSPGPHVRGCHTIDLILGLG